MKTKMYLNIGDWSGDGHSYSDKILLKSNKSVEEIQQAYKDSCKLTGLSFNHNEDYTGLNLPYNHPEIDDRRIATEYQSDTISKLAEKILLKHGIDVWEGFDVENECDKNEDNVIIDGPEHFVELWTKFVKLSLPDLELDIVEDKDNIPNINGYWSKNLNVQFGYGLYNN
jgi:hypothetical protein